MSDKTKEFTLPRLYYSSAVQAGELFSKYSKLDLKKIEIEKGKYKLIKKYGFANKRELCTRVFYRAFHQMFQDVLKGNTFVFPHRTTTAVLSLQEYTEEMSKKLFTSYPDLLNYEYLSSTNFKLTRPRLKLSFYDTDKEKSINRYMGMIYSSTYHKQLSDNIIHRREKMDFTIKRYKDYVYIAKEIFPYLTEAGAKYILNLGFVRILNFLKQGISVMIREHGTNRYVHLYYEKLALNHKRGYDYFKKFFGLEDGYDPTKVHKQDLLMFIHSESALRLSYYWGEELTPYISFNKDERIELAETGKTKGGVIALTKRNAEVFNFPAFRLKDFYVEAAETKKYLFNKGFYSAPNKNLITFDYFKIDEKAKHKYFFKGIK